VGSGIPAPEFRKRRKGGREVVLGWPFVVIKSVLQNDYQSVSSVYAKYPPNPRFRGSCTFILHFAYLLYYHGSLTCGGQYGNVQFLSKVWQMCKKFIWKCMDKFTWGLWTYVNRNWTSQTKFCFLQFLIVFSTHFFGSFYRALFSFFWFY
jgi:hypothetical protein